jgi:MoaA/NifB/PqqE/SkfB family radical SAM enzyme
MTKYNIHQMAHTAKLAEDIMPAQSSTHNLVPVGRAGENMEDLPNTEQYEVAFNEIYEIQRRLYASQSQRLLTLYARIVKQKNTQILGMV